MSNMKRKTSEKILALLRSHYPDAEIRLPKNRFRLLIGTILSAQSSDRQTIAVAKKLFARYKNAEELAKAKRSDVEAIIRGIGLYKMKAERIIKASRILVEKHAGKVPDSMNELLELPGVGRKTANIVLGKGFGKQEGIAVDTHVFRLSRRIGLSNAKTAGGVEKDLMKLFPKSEWTLLTDLLIAHGRNICKAQRPRCEECFLKKMCKWYHAQKAFSKQNSPICK